MYIVISDIWSGIIFIDEYGSWNNQYKGSKLPTVEPPVGQGPDPAGSGWAPIPESQKRTLSPIQELGIKLEKDKTWIVETFGLNPEYLTFEKIWDKLHMWKGIPFDSHNQDRGLIRLFLQDHPEVDKAKRLRDLFGELGSSVHKLKATDGLTQAFKRG